MGQSNSKIEVSEGLMLPDRKKRKRSRTDKEDKNKKESDHTKNGSGDGHDETRTSLALRREAAGNAIYINRDLFSNIASFSAIQDVISFAAANKNTKQTVCKFLSHWKCWDGDCPWSDGDCHNELFRGLGDSGSRLPARCPVCRKHFCGKCTIKCPDCGLTYYRRCAHMVFYRCPIHQVFHCEACNFTGSCECCGQGYCRDADGIAMGMCDTCNIFSCTDCTTFVQCEACPPHGKVFCRKCAVASDFDQCDECNSIFCAECSPGNMEEKCDECDAGYCRKCSPGNMETYPALGVTACEDCQNDGL